MPVAQQTFVESASAGWRRIGRWSAMFGLAVSAFGSSIDALAWQQGGEIGAVGWCAFGLYTVFMMGAVYFAASDILGLNATLASCLRFIVTTVALFIPLLATFGLLLLVKPFLSEGWRVSFLLVGVMASIAIMALLPAWPLAQSLQTRMVSPLTIFRATRGHRGGLIILSFAIGTINKADFIPKMKTANNIGEVVLIAVGNSLMGLVTIAFTASIAAAALQFAVRNDERIGI